jgi:hypothetical protein
MLNSVRDVLVVVAQRQQTGGWFRRWTILPEEFHRDNVLLVTVALAKGLIRFNGGYGLRLTRRGRRLLAPRTWRS